MKNSDENIASPCVKNCCLDNNDICVGCFRSLEEILMWGAAEHSLKEQILLNCHERKKINPRYSSDTPS